MLIGFISGLIVAFILSLFSVDTMIIQVIQEIFSKDISTATYYIGFGLIGLIGGAFKRK